MRYLNIISTSIFLATLSALSAVSSEEPLPIPGWWTAESTRIVNPDAAENNYAPVNIGQLKHTALMAIRHLESTFGEGGLREDVLALKTSFTTATASMGDQYAPANLGQLKSVALPLYNQLIIGGIDTRHYLKGIGYPDDWDAFYPWELPPEKGEEGSPAREKYDKWLNSNYAIANIGQLKSVFSMDLGQDLNGNGIADGWELLHYGNLKSCDPHGDSDGDGLSNLLEYKLGTNPFNPDTDGDGLSDGWEYINETDPLDNGSIDPQNGPNGRGEYGSTNKQLHDSGRNRDDDYISSPGMPQGFNAPQDGITTTSIKLQWGAGIASGGIPITNYLLYRNDDFIAKLPASTLEYTDQSFILPEDDGITLNYKIMSLNSAGKVSTPSERHVRVGDFMAAEVTVQQKIWESQADGGIEAFKTEPGEPVKYYNLFKGTIESDEISRSYSYSLSKRIYPHSPLSSIIAKSTSRYSYSYTSSSTLYQNFKEQEAWERGSSTKSSNSSGSWFRYEYGESDTGSDSESFGPETESFENDYSGSSYAPWGPFPDWDVTETTATWSYEEEEGSEDNEPPADIDDPETSITIPDGWEEPSPSSPEDDDYDPESIYYAEEASESNSYDKRSGRIRYTLSEEITPTVRRSWCEELLMSEREPEFGETKSVHLHGDVAILANGTADSVYSRWKATNASGELRKATYKYRVDEVSDKSKRYYIPIMHTFTPFDANGLPLADERTILVQKKIQCSDALIAASIADENAFPSEAFVLDAPNESGEYAVLFSDHKLEITMPESVQLPYPEDDGAPTSRLRFTGSELRDGTLVPINVKMRNRSIFKNIGIFLQVFGKGEMDLLVESVNDLPVGLTGIPVLVGIATYYKITKFSKTEGGYELSHISSDKSDIAFPSRIFLYVREPGRINIHPYYNLDSGKIWIGSVKYTNVFPPIDLGLDFNGDDRIEFIREYFNFDENGLPSSFKNNATSIKDAPRLNSEIYNNQPAINLWCNDDKDGDEKDTQLGWFTRCDGADAGILTMRDLEDLHLFSVKVVGGVALRELFDNKEWALHLKIRGRLPSGQNIPDKKSYWRIYRASHTPDGSRVDLTTEEGAQAQFNLSSLNAHKNRIYMDTGNGGVLHSYGFAWSLTGSDITSGRIVDPVISVAENGEDLIFSFLVESAVAQNLEVSAYIRAKENASESPSPLFLKFDSIKKQIYAWQCKKNELGTGRTPGAKVAIGPLEPVDGYLNEIKTPKSEAEKDFVLFVHGFRVHEPWEKQAWLETVYKRLYHSGYKGSFGGFFWNTVGDLFTNNTYNYDLSDFLAWKSAERLKELLVALRSKGYRVHLMAHSQGNVVATEALRQWAASNTTELVSSYIAMQAAIPAAIYSNQDFENIGGDRNTPDVYRHYFTGAETDPPYLLAINATDPARFAAAANKMINFYNPEDFALNEKSFHWEWTQRTKPNNSLTTPDGTFFNNSSYYYSPESGAYVSVGVTEIAEMGSYIFADIKYLSETLQMESDKYEIFSFVCGAYSRALGRSGSVSNFENINLKSDPYSFTDSENDHGGQFYGPMYEKYSFWRELMKKIYDFKNE